MPKLNIPSDGEVEVPDSFLSEAQAWARGIDEMASTIIMIQRSNMSCQAKTAAAVACANTIMDMNRSVRAALDAMV